MDMDSIDIDIPNIIMSSQSYIINCNCLIWPYFNVPWSHKTDLIVLNSNFNISRLIATDKLAKTRV